MHHFPALCIICLWLHHLLASCIIIPKLHHTSASCIIPLHHASFVCIMHHKLPSYYSRNYPEGIDLGSLLKRSKTARNNPNIICFDPHKSSKTIRNGTKVIDFDPLRCSKTARNNPKVICFDLLKRSKTARNDPKVIGFAPHKRSKTARNYTKVIGFDRLKRSKTARKDPKIIGFDLLKRSKTARNGSKVIGLDPLKHSKMSTSWAHSQCLWTVIDNLVTNGVPEVPKLSYRCVPEGSCLALPSTAFRLELVQKSLSLASVQSCPIHSANSSPLGEHTRVTSHKHTPDHNALLSNARTGAQRMSYAVTGVGRCSCESDPRLAR